MIKYVVFDFDGTLVDTNYLIEKTIRTTAKTLLNRELDQSVLDEIWGKVLNEQMATLDESRVDELARFYSDYYREHRDEHTTIFEGIIEMLDALHQNNIQMGIVTNKGTVGLQHGLEKFKIKDFFKIALSKTDVVMKKPHPEGLYKVMEYFNAKPEEVLFVGDSIHDIECGKNAGVKTVLVKWTVMDLNKLMAENPTYVISEPKELLAIIKGDSI
ncbi:MAG: HAD-IIIA family hydrolase [Clostridia bacterium]|nr:HAD-IIIA family hydrolase [Clostridia bacterium]